MMNNITPGQFNAPFQIGKTFTVDVDANGDLALTVNAEVSGYSATLGPSLLDLESSQGPVSLQLQPALDNVLILNGITLISGDGSFCTSSGQVIDSGGNIILQSIAGGQNIFSVTTSKNIITGGNHQYFDSGGHKILDVQQAAIANNSGTLADVSAKLNAALAALRAHGLIAT